MLWFKSKKQVEKVQSLKPELAKKIIHGELVLRSFRLCYYDSHKKPYSAYFEYHEQGKRYGEGIEREVRLEATTWPELIDKVAEHLSDEGALA